MGKKIRKFPSIKKNNNFQQKQLKTKTRIQVIPDSSSIVI